MVNLLFNNETKLRPWGDDGLKKFVVKLNLKELIAKLKELEKVPENTIKGLKKEMDKSWKPEIMSQTGQLALNFFKWVNAMYDCWYIKKETRPLIEENN